MTDKLYTREELVKVINEIIDESYDTNCGTSCVCNVEEVAQAALSALEAIGAVNIANKPQVTEVELEEVLIKIGGIDSFDADEAARILLQQFEIRRK